MRKNGKPGLWCEWGEAGPLLPGEVRFEDVEPRDGERVAVRWRHTGTESVGRYDHLTGCVWWDRQTCANAGFFHGWRPATPVLQQHDGGAE